MEIVLNALGVLFLICVFGIAAFCDCGGFLYHCEKDELFKRIQDLEKRKSPIRNEVKPRPKRGKK